MIREAGSGAVLLIPTERRATKSLNIECKRSRDDLRDLWKVGRRFLFSATIPVGAFAVSASNHKSGSSAVHRRMQSLQSPPRMKKSKKCKLLRRSKPSTCCRISVNRTQNPAKRRPHVESSDHSRGFRLKVKLQKISGEKSEESYAHRGGIRGFLDGGENRWNMTKRWRCEGKVIKRQ